LPDTWQVPRLVAHVPRCCYTEPQLAAVGLTKAEAAASGIAIDTYVSSLEHNDRVILEGQVRCLPLIATDCLWLPLVATGCHWLPLIATDCHWFPLVSTGFH
jgi:hypothetical protein